MNFVNSIKDYIKKSSGVIVQNLLKDLKVKSWGRAKIESGTIRINLPPIKISSVNLKIKIIDTKTGEAISDIPIPINTEIKINPIEIKLEPIEIDPKIDVKLG